jgi:hypothetical protein
VPSIPDQDMCADCCRPSAWHERGGGPRPEHTFPCPSWPRWAARIRQVREMLERAAESNMSERADPPPPKPTPLAVVESGLPIAEVIQRLQELQAQHPTTEVRRGRNNRWGLWASAEPQDHGST